VVTSTIIGVMVIIHAVARLVVQTNDEVGGNVAIRLDSTLYVDRVPYLEIRELRYSTPEPCRLRNRDRGACPVALLDDKTRAARVNAGDGPMYGALVIVVIIIISLTFSGPWSAGGAWGALGVRGGLRGSGAQGDDNISVSTLSGLRGAGGVTSIIGVMVISAVMPRC
jgi:hypothetical protein